MNEDDRMEPYDSFAEIREKAEAFEPKTKPMPEEGKRVLALYRGEWIVLEVGIEHPTFEETFQAFKYWFEPFNDMLCIECFDVTDWQELPEQNGK